ncbi:protein-glutamate O-methyltransferase CheR [Cellulomonas sp. URHE0023]|uniref:CheR family methyltransferase n=1 Tax=Cellulomonas sp. URHE0023 TaxID=1380354 RepID=UPI0009DF6588|nr:protein-glutamate O-methyltransferase CheR [Cellulomonas sp. URHE0023]
MAVSAESFAFVADLVRRRSAIQLAPGKEYLVESRLLSLAREDGAADVDAFVRTVRSSAKESDFARIVEALTTNETSWFRDSAPFAALQSYVVPELIAARGTSARLKVWSAACSTGQEPYSIAMTLADCLPASASADILATDLSEQVLAKAREGRYSQLEVNRGLPATMLVRHLSRVGAEWQISQALRNLVTFRQHNLLDLPPIGGPFDVVYLRNVLIYFDIATKRAILERLRRVMKPDGILMLGAAETTIGVDDAWIRVPVGTGSVYRPNRPLAASVPISTVPQPRTAPYSSVLTRGAHS